jgi:hypothetical protein
MVMEIHIQVDEADLRKAQSLTGIMDHQQLLQFVLKRFAQLESGVQAARMRGVDPGFEVPPRRRPDDPVK